MTTQRLIRVLVYEGTPEWIQHHLEKRGVKGSFTTKEGTIREAIVGDFLETFDSTTPPEKGDEGSPDD